MELWAVALRAAHFCHPPCPRNRPNYHKIIETSVSLTGPLAIYTFILEGPIIAQSQLKDQLSLKRVAAFKKRWLLLWPGHTVDGSNKSGTAHPTCMKFLVNNGTKLPYQLVTLSRISGCHQQMPWVSAVIFPLIKFGCSHGSGPQFQAMNWALGPNAMEKPTFWMCVCWLISWSFNGKMMVNVQ